MGLFDRRIEIKTPGQIDAMRVAGLVVAETLAHAVQCATEYILWRMMRHRK